MRLRAISALAGATAITAAAIIGVTISPAMAEGNSALCIATTSYCIYAPGDDGLHSTYGVIMSASAASEWVYPELHEGALPIVDPPDGPCLADITGYDIVTADTSCDTNGGGELWTNFYNASTKHTEFVLNGVLNANGSNLCLSFDQSGTDVPGNTPNILRADPCTLGSSPSTHWYQQWTS